VNGARDGNYSLSNLSMHLRDSVKVIHMHFSTIYYIYSNPVSVKSQHRDLGLIAPSGHFILIM